MENAIKILDDLEVPLFQINFQMKEYLQVPQ